MTKLWHISDVHLSFQDDGSIRKPMDQRKWSVGCTAYQGYLDKIREFSDANIADDDVVAITGDIVHDMKLSQLVHSLRWLRENIRGVIVVVRGNHDHNWSVSDARVMHGLPRFFLLDEGEMLAIGPYMFGCFSDHSRKTSDMTSIDNRYVNFACELSEHAALKRLMPVMLSHYPVSKGTAQTIADNTDIRAYLSGHVHCTSNEEGDENGVHWKWYRTSAGQTDDKTFGKCYFSTGTTDVLLAKHGQIFKEIKSCKTSSVSHDEMKKLQDRAANAFGCGPKFVSKFERVDPFNPGNKLAGFVCRKKGKMYGSLYITHVNGIVVSPQLVYGTPKLDYPYKDTSDNREFKDLSARKFLLMNKWNGVNICFYRYHDRTGAEYITAKSKGTPFVSDSEVGNFLSLTRKALTHELNRLIDSKLLGEERYQSITFELCGKKEPHLVKYSFDIKLEPLYLTFGNGSIHPAPMVSLGNSGTSGYSVPPDKIVGHCKQLQEQSLQVNEVYRAEHGLELRYEYEHFATEGSVLYPLNDHDLVIDRTMYKIKPPDVEEVHWQTFDKTMRSRVREAVKKIKMNEEEITPDAIREELDMGPKEWGKFGKQISGFLNNLHEVDNKVIILGGIPGSGKSTVSSILKSKGWEVVNQDTLGSRTACKRAMRSALNNTKNVVVDRCNFNENQRSPWLEIAHEYGVSDVACVWLDISRDDALERVEKRDDHPTIKNSEDARKAVYAMYKNARLPSDNEGFSRVEVISSNEPAHEIAAKLEKL